MINTGMFQAEAQQPGAGQAPEHSVALPVAVVAVPGWPCPGHPCSAALLVDWSWCRLPSSL